MNKKNKIKKDCTNCLYFESETFYGFCNKHTIIIKKNTDPCDKYEECKNE